MVTKINVWAGSGENTILSNLAPREFTYRGMLYFSVEHAYQTLKSGEFDDDTYVKYKKGKSAKIIGRKGTLTHNNWNLNMMVQIVEASFRCCPVAQKALLDTGDAQFTHTQDRGVWRSAFPKILTEVRKRIRENSNGPQETHK